MFDVGVRCCDILCGCPLTGGTPFGGRDVSVHRRRGFDPSVGGRRGWRCGWRWPPMTRCCARRSRRTAASCSSTPATVCAPHSRRRGRRWMLRWPRSGRWSCRCGWARDRRSRAAGGLLRRGAQSCRAGDGRRARRSDPVGRVDGGSAAAEWIWWIWGRGGCGSADTGRGVPGPGRRPADGISAVAGAGCDVREICALRHELDRARVRGRRGASGAAGASVGDVDRGGRGRQDAAGDGSRRAAGR